MTVAGRYRHLLCTQYSSKQLSCCTPIFLQLFHESFANYISNKQITSSANDVLTPEALAWTEPPVVFVRCSGFTDSLRLKLHATNVNHMRNKHASIPTEGHPTYISDSLILWVCLSPQTLWRLLHNAHPLHRWTWEALGGTPQSPSSSVHSNRHQMSFSFWLSPGSMCLFPTSMKPLNKDAT
jgi:hypothetical protein